MTTETADHGVVTEAGAIRFERLLPGPIERVWAYLTESEKRGTWLATGAMEMRPGGAFEHVWRNSELTGHDDPPPAKYADHVEYRMQGVVLEVDPPRRLVQEWREGDAVTEVVYELAQADDKVLLVLTHRRLPTRSMLIGVAGGWHTHLEILAARLEGRAPPSFWAAFAGKEEEYGARIPAE